MRLPLSSFGRCIGRTSLFIYLCFDLADMTEGTCFLYSPFSLTVSVNRPLIKIALRVPADTRDAEAAGASPARWSPGLASAFTGGPHMDTSGMKSAPSAAKSRPPSDP